MNSTGTNVTKCPVLSHAKESISLDSSLGLPITLFGAATNLAILLAFATHRQLRRETLLKYMLAMAAADLAFCGLSVPDALARCHSCYFHSSRFRAAYVLWVEHYLTSCLAIFNIFVDIRIALERYVS